MDAQLVTDLAVDFDAPPAYVSPNQMNTFRPSFFDRKVCLYCVCIIGRWIALTFYGHFILQYSLRRTSKNTCAMLRSVNNCLVLHGQNCETLMGLLPENHLRTWPRS